MGGKPGQNPGCVIEGCSRKHNAQGYCRLHYDRARRAGLIHKLTDAERFWRQVDKSGTCWLWTGARAGGGNYGYFGFSGRCVGAHRYSWELVNGPMPADMFACHTCDVPLCVNPDHIYPGTPKQNNDDKMNRGRFQNRNSVKVECDYGHPLSGDNLTRDERGNRKCREYNRRRCRERRAMLKAAS